MTFENLVTFQTGTKFEVFFATMRSFTMRSFYNAKQFFSTPPPGFTMKIPSRSDLEWDFRTFYFKDLRIARKPPAEIAKRAAHQGGVQINE